MTVNRRAALGLMTAGALAMRGTAHALPATAAFVPDGLTIEWRNRPVGIDTLRPRFGWQLKPGAPGKRDVVQSAWELIVGEDAEAVRAGRGTIWHSGIVGGDVPSGQPPYPLPLKGHRRYWWAVRAADRAGRWSAWSAPEPFVTGVLDGAEWPAYWIAADADPILPPHAPGQARPDWLPAKPLPLMRRALALDARPRRAILSICGLGQYALAINGRAVGEAALAPGWTNYRRTVLYDTHDVTGLLQRGENVLGLMLGNGMYNVEHAAGRYTKFLDSFGAPKAILLLTIEREDGRVDRVVSDGHWRWCAGPIRFSSIYGGEDWDARELPDGWDRPGFDDRDWRPVRQAPGPGGTLRASTLPPVIAAERLAPLTVTEPVPGVVLIDFGQNFAGRPEIEVRAQAGATLVALPGEALDAAGRVTQRSYNAGPGHSVEFRHTVAGTGAERLAPLFTYHGFRYLELSGVPRDAIQGIAAHKVHADIARAGTFDASPPLLRQIHGLIDNAVTSNMVSVLTDCPHREKLGWLEQTYLNAPTIFYNRDAITLYEKLVRDIAEAQQPDGMVPGIAPEYVAFVDSEGRDQIWRNSPEWGAAAVLAPWAAYRFVGDASILRAAWPAASRYCRYLDARAVDGIVDFGMGDWYDVGPNEPGEAQLTSRALTGTAIHVDCLQTMARIAPLVGRAAEAAAWVDRARAVIRRFNARFLDVQSGRYELGSQTAQAMPLALGLVPDAVRPRALALLVAAIRREGNGVTAGDIGFRYVIAALTGAGRDDVVLDMLNVRDRPSYAWQLAHGATALTEAWDANPTKSLNHFMLGHAEGWLYGRLGGLDIDHARGRPDALRIMPRILPGVRRASASYRLPEGVVACAWEVAGESVTLAVEVPSGRQANVTVPTGNRATLRIDGVPSGFRARPVPDGASVTLGSGRYQLNAVRPA